jgi:hypothetical protein
LRFGILLGILQDLFLLTGKNKNDIIFVEIKNLQSDFYFDDLIILKKENYCVYQLKRISIHYKEINLKVRYLGRLQYFNFK